MKNEATNPTWFFDPLSLKNFCAVKFEIFNQTMQESKIDYSLDLGGGAVIHYGIRHGAPIWLMDNSCGNLCAIWYDESLPN